MNQTIRPPCAATRAARGAAASLLLLLGGCVNFSPDAGFGAVDTAVRERAGSGARWIRNDRDEGEVRLAVARLLAAPLTAEAAVQIALMGNRGLQAIYAELGIAEADLVQAGRLPNPGFSYTRLARASVLEIERAFIVDLMGLLTIPIRTDIERRRFEIAKLRVAQEAVRVAAETRHAYYVAVAAQEGVRYMSQVQEAAEAGAELARRMAAAGNFSKLDEAREQLFRAESAARLARVKQAGVAGRERLARVLGLSANDAVFALPERLPELPGVPREAAALEQSALERRLDVQAALKDAESTASALGLTRATAFVSVLEVGYQRNSESGQPRQTGYEIDVRLPLFDWGGARVARAEHTYMQAVNRAADITVRARSEVREAYDAYRAAWEIARGHRDEIVPLRKRISDENVLRYNGMLVSVFELLADAREQVASVNAYIEALRDFWIADANLQYASNGGSK